MKSLAPKRNLDGDGAPEANRGFIWGRSVFKNGALSPVSKKSRHFTGGIEGDEGISLCNWVKKVRPPSLALSEKGLPLVGAFNPNILSDSSVSSVLPSRCQAFSPFRWSQALSLSVVPFRNLLLLSPVVLLACPVLKEWRFP